MATFNLTFYDLLYGLGKLISTLHMTFFSNIQTMFTLDLHSTHVGWNSHK